MKRNLLAVLVAISTAGCGSFYVEADQPQACLQLVSPQALIVIPPPPGGQGTLSANVDIGLNNAFPNFLISGSPNDHVVSFEGMTITLQGTAGATPRWLTNLTVTATNGTGTPVTIVDYTPGTAPTTATFNVGPRDPNNNLIGLLQNGGLTLAVSISYDASFPSGSTWTAGVNACFSAKVKKTLQDLINGN